VLHACVGVTSSRSIGCCRWDWGLAVTALGNDQQQVERAYPNFYNYDHGSGVTAFGLPEYYAAACTFKLMLAFWDNELRQVYLDTIFDEGDCDGQKVLSILSATYGQPKEEEVNTRQI